MLESLKIREHLPRPHTLWAVDFDRGLKKFRPDEPVRPEQREALLNSGTKIDGVFRRLKEEVGLGDQSCLESITTAQGFFQKGTITMITTVYTLQAQRLSFIASDFGHCHCRRAATPILPHSQCWADYAISWR